MPTKYLLAALRQYIKQHRIDSQMPISMLQTLEVFEIAESLMKKDAETVPPAAQ